MQRQLKKLISVVLVYLFIFNLLPTLTFTVRAAATQRTTSLNCGNFTQSESNSEEGWAWNYDTKTLTLTNVDIRSSNGSCIILPSAVDCTIVLVGNNTLIADQSASPRHGIYSEGNYTIEGNGTLTVKALIYSSNAIVSKKSLTIKDCTINAENICDTESTVRAYNDITIDNATLNIKADDIEAISVSNGTILISDSVITTNSEYVGLYNYGGSIEVNDSTINTYSGYFTAWYAEGLIEIINSTITIDADTGIGIYAPNNDINITNSTLDVTTTAHTAVYTPAGSINFIGGQHKLKASTYAVQANNELNINGLSVKGWNGSNYTIKGEVGQRSDNFRKVFIQSSTTNYLSDVEIKTAKTFTEVNKDIMGTSDFFVNSSNLDDVAEHIVKPADIEGDNTFTLSLNVSDNVNQSETVAIKEFADKGNEVYFFDVTLIKSINDGANITNTPLENTPIPVEVHIQLTGDLAGKSYYKVYRYHGGVVEQISNDTSKAEHYVVDVANSEIIIYTMKFSTYAIFGNDISLQNIDDSEDMDVQAKITDSSVGIYKVDITWGAMAFEWDSSDKTYDPDTHLWTYGAGGSWTVASHDGVNNKITCANHSNGSLLASFDVVGTFTNVNYEVLTTNILTGTKATNMPLSKVPNESATAPEIEAYLWLDGEPDSSEMTQLSGLGENQWLKIGVITVTFEPDTVDLEKTPRN